MSLTEQYQFQLQQELKQLQQKIQTMQYFPEYRGILILKNVRCGKKGCRCERGELHGPYVYLQYYADKRKVQKYVPRKEAPKVAEKLAANKAYESVLKRIHFIKKELEKGERSIEKENIQRVIKPENTEK